MTICVGSSLHRRAHQLQFAMTPPKSLHPTDPLSSSFPSRHPPSLVPGHQVSDSWHLLFCHSTAFVSACLCSQLGLCLPQGAPQLVSHRCYIGIHFPGGGLSHGGLIAANGGEDKVDWEPRPSSKH